ncbi:MAG TPA: alpha/beta hydrolase [Glaciihabitans sp.]|jgi:pimeloyl-ACP methyl ester carboxylesterase|nr:alpha/beta hydrolase [Glaciihabitans sp.]
MPEIAHKTTKSADDTTIGFRIAGPRFGVYRIALIEGALATQDNGDGKALAEALMRDHRVVTYDRRGRGDSLGAHSFSLDTELDDLAAVIAAAGGVDIVCGFSSGAVIALYDAARTRRDARYILFEPPLVGYDPAAVPDAAVMAKLAQLLNEGRNAAAVQHWMCRVVGIPAPIVWILRRTQPRAKRPDGPNNARSLLGDAAVVEATRFAIPVEASAIRQSTIVVSGTESVAQLRGASEAVAAVIPGAELRWLEGESHTPAAGPMASLIREFEDSER